MTEHATKPLTCEKCGQGIMEAKKIFRLSGCLVAIGYFLLAVSFGCLGFSCLVGGLMVAGAGATATGAVAASPTRLLVDALTREGFPDWALDEIRSSGRLSDRSQARLTQQQRARYDGATAGVAIAKGGAVMASGMAGLLGVGSVVASFCAGIPSFIVGFLLVLKRKVMACNQCGYLYDVA